MTATDAYSGRETIQPAGVRRDEIEQLLDKAPRTKNLVRRIDWFSRRFLSQPYVADSLVGGPSTPEIFSARFDGFDCVTYIETVLSLAISRTAKQFSALLSGLRYSGGEVDWRARNHYMAGWISQNSDVISVRAFGDSMRLVRTLNVVPGLDPIRSPILAVPRQHLGRHLAMIQNGDIILFVSLKESLDVFHAGLLFWKRRGLVMRHASRSSRRVIEQPLRQFIRAQRMRGVVLLHPEL